MDETYEDAVKEFVKLRKIMIDDLETLNKYLIEDPLNECLIRLFAKTLYTFIETSAFIWKRIAYLKELHDLTSKKINEPRLSEAEASAILERSFYVNEAGVAKKRESFVEPGRNLKFALRVFAKTHDIKYESILETDGWSAYYEGLRLRNRLTHPKSHEDLIVYDEDNDLLEHVFNWFFGGIIFLGIGKTKVH